MQRNFSNANAGPCLRSCVWITRFFCQPITRRTTGRARKRIPAPRLISKKAIESIGELTASSPISSLLVTSYLRTTYSGLLANSYQQETSNPDDIAFVLELNRGTEETMVRFELTKTELARTRILLVTSNDTQVIPIDKLEIGSGIAITYIKDLRDAATKADDEILIEVTPQSR